MDITIHNIVKVFKEIQALDNGKKFMDLTILNKEGNIDTITFWFNDNKPIFVKGSLSDALDYKHDKLLRRDKE